MPMDDSFRGGGGGGGDGTKKGGEGGGGNGGGGGDGDGHEVRVKTDVAPEWNPYEDSDEEDGGKQTEYSGSGRNKSRG